MKHKRMTSGREDIPFFFLIYISTKTLHALSASRIGHPTLTIRAAAVRVGWYLHSIVFFSLPFFFYFFFLLAYSNTSSRSLTSWSCVTRVSYHQLYFCIGRSGGRASFQYEAENDILPASSSNWRTYCLAGRSKPIFHWQINEMGKGKGETPGRWSLFIYFYIFK